MRTLRIDDAGIDGLVPLDASWRGRFRAAVEAGNQEGFAYYLPHLLAKNRSKTAILCEEDAGSLCLYQWQLEDAWPRLDLVVAPVPMQSGVLQRALERANDFNQDRSARVMRIDDKDRAAAAQLPGLHVRPRKQQYLYDPGAFGDLAGRRFRTLRRNVALLDGFDALVVESFDPDRHLQGCLELLDRWKRHHRARHGTAGGVGTSRRILQATRDLQPPDLAGQVISVDGRLVAYSLGGAIRSGLACYSEAKCDPEIAGLSYFQRWRYLESLRDYDRVNDGSDAGRTGLEQLKRSLRPVGMHVEHRGVQEGSRR